MTGALSWVAERIRAAGGSRHPLGVVYLAFIDFMTRLMYAEGRVQVRADRGLGFLSSFIMGVFFSAGWIPCVGPGAGVDLPAGQ